MAELTEAEKQALIADAQAQADVAPTPVDPVPAELAITPPTTNVPVDNGNAPEEVSTVTPMGWAPEEPQNTERIGPDMEAAVTVDQAGAAGKPMKPSTAPTAGVGAIAEWGPYNDYEIINTGWGEFAVEKGMVLFFEQGERFSHKAGQFVQVNIPRYREIHETQSEALARIKDVEARRPVRA